MLILKWVLLVVSGVLLVGSGGCVFFGLSLVNWDLKEVLSPWGLIFLAPILFFAFLCRRLYVSITQDTTHPTDSPR
jgi:hypothetical protein